MRNSLLIIIFIAMIECIDKKGGEKSTPIIKKSIIKKPLKTQGTTEIPFNKEIFTDSTKIAKQGKYKIEITQNTVDTLTKVSFKLFEKENSKWKNIQNYSLNKESEIPLITEISDFNNDGLNDFTIHYSTAGRGANDIRKLFIFSKKENKFIEIKNSDDYPNLAYNKKLNCIDALSVYSGSTTTFLKLNHNTLTEFARVDFMDGNVESFLIQNNKETKLHSQKYKGYTDEMVRFVNYDPIEE